MADSERRGSPLQHPAMLDDLTGSFQRLSASLLPDGWGSDQPKFYLHREESGTFNLRPLDGLEDVFDGFSAIHVGPSREAMEKQALLPPMKGKPNGKAERPKQPEPPRRRAIWKLIFPPRNRRGIRAEARQQSAVTPKPIAQRAGQGPNTLHSVVPWTKLGGEG